jgi:hypothetical protein
MKMKPQTKKAIALTVVALFVSILLFAKNKIQPVITSITKTPAKRIYDTLIAQGLSATLAKLVVAQTKHETANYTSNVYKTLNNIGGYKYVGQKIAINGTGSPEGNNYAKYKSIEDSAIDLAGWYKRRATTFNAIKGGDIQAYCNALKTYEYYTNPVSEYLQGMKRFYTDTIA